MLRKIHLHGHLGEEFGYMHELDVTTAGEALRALKANFKTFIELLRIGSYEVIRGDQVTGLRLDEEDINDFQLGRAGDLHFVPVVEGAKEQGGILKAILGVVLVGAAVFFSGGALGTALPGMLGGLTWGNVAMIGIGLAAAGVSQLISPSEDDSDEETDSYTLTGATNVYEQGNPVPLIYGEVMSGGHVISAGIDIEQLDQFGFNAAGGAVE